MDYGVRHPISDLSTIRHCSSSLLSSFQFNNHNHGVKLPRHSSAWFGRTVGQTLGRKATMKVICNRGSLLEALSIAGNAVAARTPKPILQCVKVSAANDRITVAATDLEVAIRYSDA